jgi:hypothetical protein
MDIDFANVWKAVGWTDFANVSELPTFGKMLRKMMASLFAFSEMNFLFLRRNSARLWVFITTAILML